MLHPFIQLICHQSPLLKPTRRLSALEDRGGNVILKGAKSFLSTDGVDKASPPVPLCVGREKEVGDITLQFLA